MELVRSMVNSVLVLLIASLILVGIAKRLSLSPIIGFLSVGMLVGPHGLGLIPASEEIQRVADLGIVFLMFTIGLEFSLPRLLADRSTVLKMGGLQVLASAAVFALAAYLFNQQLITSITIGIALAMSSTAIVSRMLIEHGEVNSRFGRISICILLFQDLATILYLLIMPVMHDGTVLSHVSSMIEQFAKGALVFFILLIVGRRLVRPFFRHIASMHSPELFMLAVLVVGIGAAQMAQLLDLSLALGGFMAGMVLGETEFRHQVESDIRPFQDVLLGLFFITVGMLVDLHSYGHIWPYILMVSASLFVVKTLVVYLLIIITGNPGITGVRSGVVLAHGGEFSLVILFLAIYMGMLHGEAGQVVLSAVLLSMLIAPILFRYNVVIAERLCGVSLRQMQNTIGDNIETAAKGLNSHVIICGYGRVGQNVARLLAEEGIEYLALDLEPYRLRATTDAGERVSYGDSSRRHILVSAGLERAQAIVITFNDMRASLKTLSHVHDLRPDISVIVRAADEHSLEELFNAGATEVVPDTLESSITIAAHVLTLMGVPLAKVAERSAKIRSDRYRLLRVFFHGRERSRHRDRLQVINIPENAHAVGKTLKDLRLSKYAVNVTAVRRHGIRGADPDPGMLVQAHDTLILHGSPEALSRVERYLLSGDNSA